MAAVLAVFQKTILSVGAAPARTKRPRRSSLHFPVVIDELLVEYTRAKSTNAHTHSHASPEPTQPPEPKQ